MSIEGWKLAEVDLDKKDTRFIIPWIPERLSKQLTYSDLNILKAELAMIIEKWFETKACLDNWNLKPQREIK